MTLLMILKLLGDSNGIKDPSLWLSLKVISWNILRSGLVDRD